MSERRNLLRTVSGGVIDAGLASLATFVIGLAATRIMDPADLGVYAIFFTAFLTGTVIPAQLIFTPGEVVCVSFPVGQRTRVLKRTLRVGHGAALASAATMLFATAATMGIAEPATVLGLTVTGMAAAYLSPLQDHVRRVLIKDDTAWLAAAVSVVQVVAIVLALLALRLLAVPTAWLPFGALTLANTISLAVALPIVRFGRLRPLPTPITFRSLVASGRWLVLSQLIPTGAAFLAATIVTYLAGAEALGYSEAARIAAQPLLVLGFGLSSVFEPRFMEAAGRRDVSTARHVRRVFYGFMAASGLLYLLIAGTDWVGNPVAMLVPDAYVLPGLVAFTIVANFANGATYAGQGELTGGGREKPLAHVHSVASAGLLLAAATAGGTGAFARPLGLLLQGIARLGMYGRGLSQMYRTPPTIRDRPSPPNEVAGVAGSEPAS